MRWLEEALPRVLLGRPLVVEEEVLLAVLEENGLRPDVRDIVMSAVREIKGEKSMTNGRVAGWARIAENLFGSGVESGKRKGRVNKVFRKHGTLYLARMRLFQNTSLPPSPCPRLYSRHRFNFTRNSHSTEYIRILTYLRNFFSLNDEKCTLLYVSMNMIRQSVCCSGQCTHSGGLWLGMPGQFEN